MGGCEGEQQIVCILVRHECHDSIRVQGMCESYTHVPLWWWWWVVVVAIAPDYCDLLLEHQSAHLNLCVLQVTVSGVRKGAESQLHPKTQMPMVPNRQMPMTAAALHLPMSAAQALSPPVVAC